VGVTATGLIYYSGGSCSTAPLIKCCVFM